MNHEEETITDFNLKPLDKTSFISSHENISNLDYKNLLTSTAIIVIYSAAAVASSTGLIFIPNLETITIFIFLVSFYYGLKIAFSMMITTTIIFELFASIVYGPGGFLFLFKIFSYIVNILIAVSLANILKENAKGSLFTKNISKLQVRLGFAFVGFLITLIFDLVTTLYFVFLFQNLKVFVLYFISGIPFMLFHEFTNVLIFFFVPDYVRLIELSSNTFTKGER